MFLNSTFIYNNTVHDNYSSVTVSVLLEKCSKTGLLSFVAQELSVFISSSLKNIVWSKVMC